MSLRSIFSIDLRSLALFRVFLGSVLLIDVLSRWRHFGAFYSESGILPQTAATSDAPWHFQIFFWSASDTYAHGLFALLLLASLCLIAGFRARTAAFVCWALFVSLNLRNGLILQGGDRLMGILLLWACLLPLGARASIDARRDPRVRNVPDPFLSPATAGLYLQVFFLYFSAALFKAGQPAWLDGTHLYNTFSRSEFLTLPGLWLYQFENLLPLMTWSVLLLQGIGAFLFFLPGHYARARCAVIAAFVALQLGMGLTLYIGLFPAVAIAGTLALLPPGFWERLTRVRAGSRSAGGAPRRENLREFLQANLHSPSTGSGPLPWGAFARNAFGGFLVFLLVLFNFNDHARVIDDARPYRALRDNLAFNQSWNMFSAPVNYAGWFVVAADLEDGRRINLMRDGAPVDYEKPRVVTRDFPSYRWRVLMTGRLRHHAYEAHRPRTLAYLKNTWNGNAAGNGERIRELALIELRYFIEPGYAHTDPKPHVLCRYPEPNGTGGDW